MGLKLTRTNIGGPNNNFGFQLCLIERPMIEGKSVTLHQFHFLHRTGLAKEHQGDMFALSTQTNVMLRILNKFNFVLEKKALDALTVSLIADGVGISTIGLFTNSITYMEFYNMIESMKKGWGNVSHAAIRQLSIYMKHMRNKAQLQDCGQVRKFLINGSYLPNGIKWCKKVKSQKPKALFINLAKTRQHTGQVDDLPKIDGVWMGEEKLGSSQKKKIQAGSIVLHFTRVIESGKKRYRLEKIEGAYPYSLLPKEYLSKPPNVFVTNNYTVDSIFVFPPMRVKSLILPNGSCLFTEGDMYSEKNLIPKLEYLAKAGQRLRDTKKAQHEKATTEKPKEETWEGSFVIQV